MDMYDFGSEYAQTYKEKCKCGHEIEVSTQRDDRPEYQNEVYVKCCKCDRSVCFLLPVN